MESIKEFINNYHYNGILNIEYGGKKFCEKMGYKNFKKDKIRKNTIFPIGSISKIFYGFAVIVLLDNSLIDSLNDRVCKYITNFKYKKIRIIDCLLHTSGIDAIRTNNDFDKNNSYTANGFIGLIEKLNLYKANKYGEYNYSSANYFVVGGLLDIVVGSARNFLKSIFKELNLKNTLFVDNINKSLDFATGFDSNNKVFRTPNYRKKNFYGGDICSTYQDLNAFIRTRHKMLTNRESVKLLTKDYNIGIEGSTRLGSSLIEGQKIIIGCRLININKKSYLLMAGHFPGYHVSSAYSLDYKVAINAFSNIDKFRAHQHMDELAKQFAIILSTNCRFFAKPAAQAIKKIKDADKYIGKYANEYTHYKLYLKNGKLRLYSRKQDSELYYMGHNRFYRNPYSCIKVVGDTLCVYYFTGITYQLKKIKELIK